MKTLSPTFAILVAVTVSLSANVDAWGQTARPAGISNEQLFGTMVEQAKWTSLPISVCWEDASAGDARYRSITRAAVEETWERYSKAKFTGWNRCGDNAEGVRIRVSDEGPHVKAVGRYLERRPAGMVLNFTFEKWSSSCAANREFCVYAVAVHEFGHALGFTHEQNRPDAPEECRLDSQGTTGDYLVTQYDPFSIMNYCNPQWNGDGKLSALDIEAVQKVYGAP